MRSFGMAPSPFLKSLRRVLIVAGAGFFTVSATAETATPVQWGMLVDPEARVYEDPYRELEQSQMERLMALVRARQALQAGPAKAADRHVLETRVAGLYQELEAEGLDPDWILGQREVVAERRKRAALATASELNGELVEMTGYLLAAPSLESEKMLVYLLPDRGVCMHLPPPAPNQVVQLELAQLPETIGPCIAVQLRGQLVENEARNTIPSADGATAMWSRWQLRVTELSTSGALP